VELALGLVAALIASVLFNVGVALQALDARREPASKGLRLALLGRLLRRKRWFLGFSLGALGFVFQAYALAHAPFVVVQPMLAAGLLVLLALGARVLGERVGLVEVAGVLGITVGIGLLAWGTPAHAETIRNEAAAIAVLSSLAFLGLLPFVVRGTRLDTATVVIGGSALGFGAANIATKLLADQASAGAWAAVVGWWAVALAIGVGAIITEMTALQRRPATLVVPVSFAVQTFLPVVLEPLYLAPEWNTMALYGVPLAAGLVLVGAGDFAVCRTRAVSLLSAPG
jgi:drug/metabolite transporter (DMT)-like permease